MSFIREDWIGDKMKFIKKLIFLLLIAIIIIFSVVALNGKKMYDEKISKTSLQDTIAKIESNKNYVKLEDLPDDYKNAVIAVEDHRFKKHGAIDLIAIGRAIWINVTNFELREGGSTITQQVAKNIFFISEDDALTRKSAEIFAAFDLEKNYSKDKILELYVNTIYFGDGYYGIKEACNGYLNIEPSQMTLYDCTMMAGIPNAPSVYNPSANPKLTRSRQKKVISDMVEYGYLTQDQADKLLK